MSSEFEIFLHHINLLTDRRQNVTTIYLSVNVVILAAISFILKDAQLADLTIRLSVTGLILVGLAACILWRKLILQYCALLEWWYRQVRSLEHQSDQSRKLLTLEYEELYRNIDIGKVATGLISQHEIRLTWLFFIIYFVFGVIFLINFLL